MYIFAEKEEQLRFKKDLKENEYIITGVGFPNIYLALKDLPRDTEIINIGFAGSNNIEVGKMCPIKEVRHFHPSLNFSTPSFTLKCDEKESFICYSADFFVTECNVKEPVVFDMELYSILLLGFTNVTAYKYISDNLSLDTYREERDR